VRFGSAVRWVVLSLTFVFGILIARILWDHINLPFSNPWQIRGVPSELKFNPQTNQIRYLCMVALPCLLLLSLYLVPFIGLRRLLFSSTQPSVAKQDKTPKEKPRGRSFPVTCLNIALVILLMVIALAVPSDYVTVRFDTFHEGESLGPAISFLHGQVPYKDFYVMHGFIQDCGKVALAFKLFGRSIASARTLWSMVKVLMYGLVGVLLLMLFEGQMLWIVSAVVAFVLANFCLVPVGDGMMRTVSRVINRDITTVLFLILLFTLYRRTMAGRDPSPNRIGVLASLAAFVAVGALGFSVDRGTVLVLSHLVTSVLFYFGFLRGGGAHRQRAAYVAGSISGVVVGILALGLLMRWNLTGFFGFTYGVLPHLFSMADTIAFPIENPLWFLAVSLVSFNAYWLLLKFLQTRTAGVGAGAFLSRYFREAVLLVMSVMMFTCALGISDWDHVSINSLIAFLLFLTIVFKHTLPGLVRGRARLAYVCLLSVAAVGTFGWCLSYVFTSSLLSLNFPLGKPDVEFVRDTDEETVSFFRNNLGPGENMFTMTSEGSWYYLLDQPCPTRFVLTYAAGSRYYQKETIARLKTRNVKYVIVRNDCFSNAVLGMPTLVRLPLVTDYLRRNYAPCIVIGDNVILVRRSAVGGS